MTDRELLQQVLEALEHLHRTGDTQVFDLCDAPELLPALRERLAQPDIDYKDLYEQACEQIDVLNSLMRSGEQRGVSKGLDESKDRIAALETEAASLRDINTYQDRKLAAVEAECKHWQTVADTEVARVDPLVARVVELERVLGQAVEALAVNQASWPEKDAALATARQTLGCKS